MDKIGKYRILETIGHGATSTVYKGYDDALGRYVAIKTISAEAGGDETLRKRFEREAQSAARLAHPHIITLYDFGQEQDKLYMAMELLEGVDLKQAIAEKRLSSLDQKLDVMEQIADGLAFAHAHEIVHRDLKPANIRLLADGQVKIMDFGLARHAGSNMTRTGVVIGTPYYMSPEQMRGEHVDARSDVFSLGCLFYELLTGVKPFDAEALHTVLFQVLQAEPRPAKELAPELPDEVVRILGRCLAKDRAPRFANGTELLAAVQHARRTVTGQGETSAPGGQATMLVEAPPPTVRPQARSAVRADASSRAAGEPASPAASRRPTTSSGSGASRVDDPAPGRSRAPLYAALAVVILGIAAGVIGLVVWRARVPPALPAASPTPGKLDALARQLVATEVEIAKAKLAGGDAEEALRRAERALTFDPADRAALDVAREARARKEEIDKAVRGVQAASSIGSDPGEAGAALWSLLEVAPDHSAGEVLLGRLDSSFRKQAEEARGLMGAAQKAAEQAQAGRLATFAEGRTIAAAGDAAFAQRLYARAARDFMRARLRFERARRPGH